MLETFLILSMLTMPSELPIDYQAVWVVYLDARATVDAVASGSREEKNPIANAAFETVRYDRVCMELLLGGYLFIVSRLCGSTSRVIIAGFSFGHLVAGAGTMLETPFWKGEKELMVPLFQKTF